MIGIVEGKGTGLRKTIHQHTKAHSPAQALAFVAARMKKELMQEVYTGNCDAEAYEKNHNK